MIKNDESLNYFENATLDDVYQNPHKFGAPTFEEFLKNREYYVGKEDEILETVERGSNTLGQVVITQKYQIEIDGNVYPCRTLYEVEKIAKNEGIKLTALEIRPELINEGGLKAVLLVRFRKKN